MGRDMVPVFRRHPLATFFILTFLLTWMVWVPRAAASQGLLASDLLIVVGQVWAWIPAVAALLAAILTGGRAAVGELGSRPVRWRVGWRWYVVVIVGPAAFSLVVAIVYVLLGGSWSAAKWLLVFVLVLVAGSRLARGPRPEALPSRH
jgi:uncharacterized protein